ncbi:MAG: hypothetical protein IBX41_05525 [Methanophagales archaeon]|nr:hypothetical protein [Methanophagales archaeon]
MIKVDRESGEIHSIIMNGETLDTDDGETWFLPKGLIGEIAVNDLPDDAVFEICSRIENSVVMLDTVPIRLQRIGDNRVRLDFDDSGTRKYWDGTIGFKPYMEAKKSIVEERASEVGDVSLESYDDDGAWIHLEYSAQVDAEKLVTAVQLAEQIAAEIDGAAEMRLGVELWAPKTVENEREFTLGIVLPILRKLGFQNVKYNHGKREFGRDIVFARITEFKELEFWGAQVKFGDIAGGVDADIAMLLSQLDDAFKMPFYDLYTKQKQRISKLAIIISGKFTENAIEKICEKIESHAVRNNVLFIDGEKLQTLAEQFRSPA